MASVSEEVGQAAGQSALMVAGVLWDNADTVVLLAPGEPGFWDTFTDSPEYLDGAPDPLDRWSKRCISALAQDFGARALFPSDGPPYPPFLRWAISSGRAFSSPVGMLVHDTAGLMISLRGALIFENIRLPLVPPRGISPCVSCTERPCVAACPARALVPGSYDTTACNTHIQNPGGKDCLTGGCLVRRACPKSNKYGRLKAQSAFHMRAFSAGLSSKKENDFETSQH